MKACDNPCQAPFVVEWAAATGGDAILAVSRAYDRLLVSVSASVMWTCWKQKSTTQRALRYRFGSAA